jgi:predicted metal-dependent enzyme (double-stranded beta helix superfamily)
MTNVAPVGSALTALVETIRSTVATDHDQERVANAVADALRLYLQRPDLLQAEQREADPTRYRQHILSVEDDGSFSVVALVWLPGQVTPIHDHVSWCVVGVYEGEEHETRYEWDGSGSSRRLVVAGECVNPTGMVAALAPPGDIHRVANRGPGLAISLHVYGADIGKLGSSIRRCYDES